MDNREKPDIAEEIAAALAWWRDAGVDSDFVDDPVDWLARPEAEAPPVPVIAPVQQVARDPRPAAHAAAAAKVDRSPWPADLPGFASWWMSEPSLDGGRTAGRVPPRGQAGAELMVVVEQPEEGDAETLLSGREGRLLDAILAAAGVAPENLYLASVLPRHTPLPDWTEIGARGFGDLLSHHVALVKPKRLLAFGGNILPLAGHDLPNKPAVLRSFNHEGLSVPLLATFGLSMLLERPQWKARFWQGWLEGSQ